VAKTDSTSPARIGRYAEDPGQMPWPGWKRAIARIYVTAMDAELSLRCAGVAFFCFLSIFPVLACLVLIYGIVTDKASLQNQLLAIQPIVPQSVFEVLRDRLESLLSQPDSGLGIGLLVSFAIALWSGSRGINALILAMSSAYHERNNRSFLMNAILSLGLTISALVFFIIALFVIAAVPIAAENLVFQNRFEALALWLRWPVLLVLVWIAIAVLFRVAPHRNAPQWKWISPGAWLATFLWLALSVLFSLYVENFGNYSATFGTLSVAVVTLLWIYYSTLVIVIGASLNAELELQTRIDTTIGIPRPMGQRGAYVADHLPEQKQP
jgi:membrane protein